MVPVFWRSCFLKHLLRFEEHDLSFRLAMLWSSISFVTFCRRASCSFSVEIEKLGTRRSAVLLRVSPWLSHLVAIPKMILLLVQVDLVNHSAS